MIKKYVIEGDKDGKRVRSIFVIERENVVDEIWGDVNKAIDDYELQQHIKNLKNKGLKDITVKCEDDD